MAIVHYVVNTARFTMRDLRSHPDSKAVPACLGAAVSFAPVAVEPTRWDDAFEDVA